MYRREAAACGDFVRLLGADREKKCVTAERAKVAARMKDIVDGWGGALARENRMWWTSSNRATTRDGVCALARSGHGMVSSQLTPENNGK